MADFMQAAPGGPVMAQGGVIGGTVDPSINIAPTHPSQPSTMETLFDLGSKLLEPAIKKAQEAKFFDGMSRAAQGEVAADIAKEQPAWARFFGDDYATQGARLYEGSADASKLEVKLLTDMEADRKLTPEAYAQKVRVSVDSMKTDDPQRTIMMQQASLKLMPSVMKEHARQHVAWQQGEATRAAASNVDAAFTSFGLKAQNSTAVVGPPEKDQVQAIKDLVTIVSPPPGVEPGTYDRILSNGLKARMTAGDFAAANVFKQMGFLNKMDPALQDDFDRTYRVEGNRFILDKGMTSVDFDMLKAIQVGLIPSNKVTDAMKAMNQSLSAATGIQVDAFSTPEQLTAWARAFGREEAERGRQASGAAKAAKEAQDAQVVMEAATFMDAALVNPNMPAGGLRDVVDQKIGLTDKVQDQRVMALWGNAAKAGKEGLAVQAQMIRNGGSLYKIKPFETQVARTVGRGVEYSPEFEATYSILNTLQPDERGYYLKEYGTQFYDAYTSARAALSVGLKEGERVDQSKVFALAKQNVTFRDVTLSKGDREAIDDVVAARTASPVPAFGYFMDDTLNESGKAMLSAAMASRIGKASGITAEEKANYAYGQVKGAGFRQIGRTAFIDQTGDEGNLMQKINTDLGKGLALTPSEVEATITAEIERLAGVKGVADTGRVQLYRTGRPDQPVIFYGFAPNAAGDMTSFTIDPALFKKKAQTSKADIAAREKAEADGTLPVLSDEADAAAAFKARNKLN